MTRFLFVSLPLAGHLDWGGMLATAAVLARRPAHQVAWASGPEVAVTVGRAGIEFLDLPNTGWNDQPHLPAGLPLEQLAALRQRRALNSWLDPSTILPTAARLQDVFADWRPDAIVLEPYAAAAALAAEASGLPIIVSGRPALPDPDQHPAMTPASQRIRSLCSQIGVAGRYWDLGRAQIRSPLLHVDYFSRRWYADLPAVDPQTTFAGSRRQPTPTPGPQDLPTVLITLGSLFRDDPAFFRIAAEAVMLEGGNPLVVTGVRAGAHAADETPSGLPTGSDVRGWVDFDSVMPRLTGIIHHGGVGTTHAALRHGLPQIAVPHAGDQQPQAGRITQAGVGYGVRPVDFNLANARWLARQLLTNETLHTQTAAWREELQTLGGPTLPRVPSKQLSATASSWYNLQRDEKHNRTHRHQRPIARWRPVLPQRRCERHYSPTAAPPTGRRS